jgi:hypothetical protein
VLQYVVDFDGKSAVGGLKATGKAAEEAADAFDDMADELDDLDDALDGTGKSAGKAKKSFEQLDQATRDFSGKAGEAASVSSAMGGAIGLVAPEAEAAFSGLTGMIGGLEGLSRMGLAAMGPIGILAAAVGAAALAFTHFRNAQQAAKDAMVETKKEALRLEAVMNSIDLSRAEDSITLLAAQGKINNREVAEYNALKTVSARFEEVHNKAIEKSTLKQEELNKAKEREAKADKALVEARKTNSSSQKAATAREAHEAAQARRFVQKQAAVAEREVTKITQAIHKDADLLMDIFDANQKAGKEATGSKGGVSTFVKLLEKADNLSTPAATKLEKLNEVLAELQATSTTSTTKTAALNKRIEEVTAARDAEAQAIAKSASDKQATATAALQGKTDSLTNSMLSFARSFGPPLTALQKLESKQAVFAANFEKIKEATASAGLEGSASFMEMAASFSEAMDLIQQRIDELKEETPEAVPSAFRKGLQASIKPIAMAGSVLVRGIQSGIGFMTSWLPESFTSGVKSEFIKLGKGLVNIFSGATGTINGMLQTIQTGGASMISGLVGQMAGKAAASKAANAGGDAAAQAAAAAGAAGPAGAAAGMALQIGMGGAQAYEQAKTERAQEIAQNRQKKLEQERQAGLDEGYTEAQLAEQGLSAEDVTAAGQVTKADEKKAAKETDRGEEMGKFVEGMVTGVIEGLKSLIVGLPNIIEELVPILLTELPASLVIAVFKMIPKMLKMLFVGLPKSFLQGLAKWWPRVWDAVKSFFKKVLTLGLGQTGISHVPKTGRYILHQGERVVPASNTTSGMGQNALQAFTGGGGPSLTVNASVVDPDTIPALSRIIDKSLGSTGRTQSAFFGAKSSTQEI